MCFEEKERRWWEIFGFLVNVNVRILGDLLEGFRFVIFVVFKF